MPNLVIVRHGQSQWNLENKFTGWVDIDLSPKGEEEALKAAERLKGYEFDIAHTSDLMRAQRTLDIILKNTGQENIPVHKDKALNERMYGDLQGLNKAETILKFGDEQVKIWRRSYDIAPPKGESLKTTAERVIPYFERTIKPELQAGKNIIISAHGNSLRALMMYLEKMTKEQILEIEIPTAHPILYKLDNEMNIIEKKEL